MIFLNSFNSNKRWFVIKGLHDVQNILTYAILVYVIEV